ncbi:serine/threonine protein kinase [Rubritalea sp.]|uniref:serine/threonine protein kinase n=1 Tax=Rubritalea sp. TaxID=2109375 RepID=UPI003EF49CF8
MDPDSKGKDYYQSLLAHGLQSEALSESIEVDGCQIIRKIGQGGMSAVYLATENALNREIALKVFRIKDLNDSSIERFHQEAIMMAGIHHPNIVTIHGIINQSDSSPILVLEYLAGGDLRTKITASGTLSIKEAASIAIDVCQGLEAIHAKSIVHRDINPANILLTSEGSAKVADLGIALNIQPDKASDSLTMTGTFVGTMAYLAPEQLSSDHRAMDARTDIWAVGILLFEMVIGSPPQSLLVSDLLTEVPRPFKPLIKKCLRRKPSERYQDITLLKRDLEKILQPKRKNRIVDTIIIAALLLAVAVITLVFKKEIPDQTSSSAPLSDKNSEQQAHSQSEIAKTIGISQNLLTDYPPSNVIKRGNWFLDESTLICRSRLNSGAYTTLTDFSPGDNYDISLTITRNIGEHSATIYLPTSIGMMNFDLDGRSRNLAGIQNLDGQNIASHGETFPFAFTNNTPITLTLEVRQYSITAYTDGTKRYTWELRGRRGSITPLWDAPIQDRIAIGAWNSIMSFSDIHLKKNQLPLKPF